MKHLITDVITRLQDESSSEIAAKYHCDEEMAKSAVKKEDFEANDVKHSSKLEAAVDGEISASHRDEETSMATGREEGLEADIAMQSSLELNPFKRETAVSRSNGMDGDVAELHADLGDRLHQLNIDPTRVDVAMQQTESTQQPHRSQQRYQHRQCRETREKRPRDREKRERRCEKGRRENGVEDVTGWVEVRRRTRRREVEEGHEGEGEKNYRKVQIFVKVDGMKTVLKEVSPEDKVQKILNTVSGSDQDVYATCEGRMLRKDDELRSCGVSDGCTIQVMSKMRGGGTHTVKTSKAEKKRDRTPEKTEWTRGQEAESHKLDDNSEAASHEIDRGKAIKQFREQGTSANHQGLVGGK